MDVSADFFALQIRAGHVNTIFVRPPLPYKLAGVTKGLARGPSGDSVEYPIPGSNVESNGTADSNAGYSTGASSVAITLDTVSEIYRSDFIRYQNHDKVYMVTDVLSVNPVTHSATLEIFPALIDDVTNGENVYLGKRATMKMLYDFDVIVGIGYQDGILADPGILRMVEEV
jgi:hypothetical protein